jgi:hypothetical protein
VLAGGQPGDRHIQRGWALEANTGCA